MSNDADRYQAQHDRMSNRFMTYLAMEVAKTATVNWLFIVGQPTTPSGLLKFAVAMADAAIIKAAADGYITLSAEALASDAEQANRAAAGEQLALTGAGAGAYL